MLERVQRAPAPGGRFAAALADPYDALDGGGRLAPLPRHDRARRLGVLEPAGHGERGAGPGGRGAPPPGRVARRRALDEELAPIALDVVSPDEFEAEARSAGLEPVGRRAIPETADHIGSTVVVCRR